MHDETSWRGVFENSLDGVLLTKPDGQIIAANPRACELLQRTEEEICAEGRAGLVVVDEAAQRFLAERARLGHYRGTLTMRRKDGSTFLAQAGSAIFQTPQGQRNAVSFYDATESERSRRTLEVLADAGPALVASLDPQQILRALTELIVPKVADLCIVDLLVEGRVERVAVTHRDPKQASLVFELRRPEIRPEGGGTVDRMLRTGDPQVLTLSDEFLRRAVQNEVDFERAKTLGMHSLVTVGLNARGQLIGALSLVALQGSASFTEADLPLVRALAERAALALDNARQHREVLAARALRDEVLGIVSHDLRNPLNVILIQAGLLAKRDPGPEVESIRKAVKRADALIRDLLLAAQVDGGTLALESSPQRVDSIVEELVQAQRAVAQAKQIELVASVAADAGELSVDRHRVVQMLSNLIDNALKFTPASGRVQLRARPERDGVLFSVIDSGRGISEAELPHVFDRFWQGAHAQRAGAGLGLSIAQGVATAHGGQITVHSQEHHGATFDVWLPRRALGDSLPRRRA